MTDKLPWLALKSIPGVGLGLFQRLVGRCGAPRFPARRKQFPYPPPLLFVQGTMEPQDDLAVAVVGTRGASYYGLKTSRRLAGALAARGLTVVSGLARGIDAAAPRGALENSGRTLAALGC